MSWFKLQILLIVCIWLFGTIVPAKGATRILSLDNESLPSQTIYDIYEDHEGYIWVATPLGAYIYNGSTFKRPELQDPLLRAPILCITGIGEKKWLGLGKELKAIQVHKEIKKMDRGSKRAMAPIVIHEDTFLVSAHSLQLLISSEDTTIYCLLSPQHQPGTPTHPLPKVISITSISPGTVLLGTSKGLYSFSEKGLASIGHKFLKSKEINAVAGTRETFWFSSKNYLYQADMEGNIKDSFKIDEKEKVRNLAFSEKTGLWISSTANKVYRYQQGQLQELTSELGSKGALVNKIFIDKAHNVWLGTSEKGLFLAPYTPFNYITVSDGLSQDQLHDHFQLSDSEEVLVMRNGINYWDEASKSIAKSKSWGSENYFYQGIRYSSKRAALAFAPEHNKTPERRFTIHGIEFLLVPGTSVLQLDSNRLLYGKHSGDIICHSVDQNQSTRVQQLFPAGINVMERHSDSLVLIGTRRGLMAINSLNFEQVDIFHKLPKEFAGIKSMRIDQFLTVENGVTLVLYNGGIVGFKNEVWYDATATYKIPDAYYTCMAKDGAGTLYFGHHSGLTIAYKDTILQIGTQHGLPSGHLQYMSIDQLNQTLWMSTNEGIASIPIEDLRHVRASQPRMKLLNLELMSDSIIPIPYAELSTAYNRNDIRITYDIINPSGLRKASIFYKMNNLESDWIPAESNGLGLYNLPPGDYKIWFGAGYSDVHLAPKASVNFTVLSPFWKTGLGLTVITLSLLSVLFGLFALRIRFIKSAEEEKRRNMGEIYRLQQKSLRAMMNPHFIFNSLNSVQSLALKHNDRDASQFIADLAKFIRAQMHMLEKDSILLSEEIKQLKLYIELETRRFGDAFHEEIVITPGLLNSTIEIPPMILQPFVENAIWHGLLPKQGSKKLIVRIEHIKEHLLIHIEDNGVGFQEGKNDEHESRGIQLIRERLMHHNGEKFQQDLSITSHPNTGTTVRISIRCNG